MSDLEEEQGAHTNRGPASAKANEARRTSARWTPYLSIFIALAALFLSVATTALDFRRSANEDRHSAGLELTDLVQRLVALPRQYAEAARAPDTDTALSYAGFSQEKAALATRAAGILEQYPAVASAVEYEVIAEALVTDIDNDVVNVQAVSSSISLLEQANGHTDRSEEEKASLLARAGGILFRVDDFERAREFYRRSVSSVATDRALRHLASYYEALWGQWEASRNQCEAARQHLEPARAFLKDSGTSESSEAIDDLESRIGRCSTGSAASEEPPERPAGSGG